MNQSAVIGGALLAGFVLFLAARDRLSTYAHIFWASDPHGAGAPVKPEAKSDSRTLGDMLLGPFNFDLPELPSLPDLSGF